MKGGAGRMRWGIVVASVALLVAGSLVAQAAEWSLTEAAKPYRGKTLYVTLNTHPANEAMQPLLADFESQTGIKVEMELMKNMELLKKEEIELATGTTAWDVMHFNVSIVQRFAQADWPTPLQQFINDPALTPPDWDMDDIFAPMLQVFSRDEVLGNDLLGLPYVGGSSNIFYRSDIYDQYGVEPADTFDEFVDVCQTIDTPEIPAFACRARRGMGFNVFIWAGFVKAYGAEWFDTDMKPALDSPEAARALEMFVELLQRFGPEGVASYTHYETYTDFAQGKLASFIDANVWNRVFMDPAKSKVVGKWAAAMLPKGPAGRGPSVDGHAMMIPKATDNKEMAWLFCQWYASKNTQLRRAMEQGSADVTRISITEDPAYIEKFNVGDWVDVSYDSLRQAEVPYWPAYLPEWSEIGDTVGIYLQKAVLDEMTPAEALAQANKEVEQIMADAGYYN